MTKLVKFYLYDFLADSNELDMDLIKKKLYSMGIQSKIYYEDNLMIIYNIYNNSNTELQIECRSVVLNTYTRQIISYGCNTIKLAHENYNLQEYFNHIDKNDVCSKCYEGSYMSLFYFNDKWYFSTRKIIKVNNTIEHKQYTMFLEIVNKLGYDDVEKFYDTLDKSLNYHYIIVHHNNKDIIDYTNIFGKEYMFLYLVSIKDINMIELDINDYVYPYDTYTHYKKLELTTYKDYVMENSILTNPVENEGVVIRSFNNNKYTVFKFQTISYLFEKYSKICKVVGLMVLYQTNKLYLYPNYNKDIDIDDINISPYNLIDYTYKCIAMEFLYLCNFFWNNNIQNNKKIYFQLSKEYKYLLYKIRNLKINSLIYTDADINLALCILKQININKIINILHYRKNFNSTITFNINNSHYHEYENVCNLVYNLIITKKIIVNM